MGGWGVLPGTFPAAAAAAGTLPPRPPPPGELPRPEGKVDSDHQRDYCCESIVIILINLKGRLSCS